MLILVATGRLTKDPELKGNGKVGIFTLATTIPETNENGERKTEFLNCVCFGKTAENLATYTKKGSLLSIKGYPKTDSYEKDGHKQYFLRYHIQEIEYL